MKAFLLCKKRWESKLFLSNDRSPLTLAAIQQRTSLCIPLNYWCHSKMPKANFLRRWYDLSLTLNIWDFYQIAPLIFYTTCRKKRLLSSQEEHEQILKVQTCRFQHLELLNRKNFCTHAFLNLPGKHRKIL